MFNLYSQRQTYLIHTIELHKFVNISPKLTSTVVFEVDFNYSLKFVCTGPFRCSPSKYIIVLSTKIEETSHFNLSQEQHISHII